MSITGLARLHAKLKRIPKDVRSSVRQALAEGADDITDMQKRLVPVDSGALRDSIQSTFGDGSLPKHAAFRSRRGKKIIQSNDPDLSVTITAGNSKVRYAHIVEFGTAPFVNGGSHAGTQNPGQAKQPFFFPAYRILKRPVQARIRKAVRAGARKAVGR